MDAHLDSLLLALALNHRLAGTLAPDAVSTAFLDADREVPLIVADGVLGTDTPTGLLLFAAAAKASGITPRPARPQPSLAAAHDPAS